MKQIISIIVLFLFMGSSLAQETIQASDLLKRIDAGENIELSNAVIKGDLRLIDLSNRTKKEKDGDQEHYIAFVKSSLKFRNCIFENKVVAYESIENNGPLYTADFENDFIAEECNFKDDFLVKYSKFEGKSDFSKSKFQNDALFKYSKFEKVAEFNNTSYREEANFKYAEFEDGVDFSQSSFISEANFKYSKFQKVANFSKCITA